MVTARFCGVAPVDTTQPSFETECDSPFEQCRFSGLVLDGGSNDGCVRSDSLSFLSNSLPTSSKRLDDPSRREKLLDINVPRNMTRLSSLAHSSFCRSIPWRCGHGERAPSQLGTNRLLVAVALPIFGGLYYALLGFLLFG
jgi:hypothetical protein